MFRCPVPACRAPLIEADDRRTWRCPSGHVHDVAREGYVNLLVTHQRRAREPGDSAEMLRHRRAFLEAGHYGVLRDAVRAAAGDLRPEVAVLDAGCGEGYYTRDWPVTLRGVDIARPAVRLAAKRARPDADARYAVASVYDLPVVDGSVDLVVSIFAPLHSPEFERVVRNGGRVLTVTPGPDHLAGLKARLFAEPEAHPATGPFEREGATTGLVAEGTERVRAHLHLTDAGDVDHLLHMTPYAWYVAPEVRAGVVSEGPLSTPIDFLVSAYRRT
ncbi:MAG TPA: methyltransferase domain-containing protein [Acidimicrobiales bacterium]|nr:methyltransferase domain-containing protein [Acidimicrobiales bacterium]